jgi:hypothetical protein
MAGQFDRKTEAISRKKSKTLKYVRLDRAVSSLRLRIDAPLLLK